MTEKVNLNQNEQKILVGKAVASLVKDGMVLGIGTGSTVEPFIDAMAEKGVKDITAVATSDRTEKYAKRKGIEILEFDMLEKEIDLAIDGADEVDKDLNLIKGGGGALTREKVVDYKAEKFVVIADEGKLGEVLGSFPLPVEVGKEKWEEVKGELEKKTGAKVGIRKKGEDFFVTDNDNYILDCKFTAIINPGNLEKMINGIPGVVQNGIFTREHVAEVWVGKEDGTVEVLKK